MEREELIVISAVRYGLGRMSYIVGEICGYVAGKRKELSIYCLNIIIRDIKEELDRFHLVGEFLGMECDEKEWTRLMELLKEEVASREQSNGNS